MSLTGPWREAAAAMFCASIGSATQPAACLAMWVLRLLYQRTLHSVSSNIMSDVRTHDVTLRACKASKLEGDEGPHSAADASAVRGRQAALNSLLIGSDVSERDSRGFERN